MAKVTKKQKEARAKVDANATYTLAEASALIKEVSKVNFDPSVGTSSETHTSDICKDINEIIFEFEFQLSMIEMDLLLPITPV